MGQSTPSRWDPRGVGGGGAIFSPSLSPHNPDELWVSCDMSPMHRSLDFGNSWETINFQALTGQRFSLVQFTADPKLVYTLKLTPTGQYDPVVSRDGGNTWSDLPDPTSFTAYRLFANPNDTGQFVVSDQLKVFYTNNSGGAYTTVYSGGAPADAYLAGVFFDGRDSVYICTDKGIFFSPNKGMNWVNHTSLGGIPPSEEIIGFAGARQGNRLVFFASTLTASKVVPKSYGEDVPFFQNLYRLSWGGSGWANITSSLPSANDKAYQVAMNPSDTSTVYLGGRTVVSSKNLGTVFKSTNSGTSWTSILMNSGTLSTNANVNVGWRGTSSSPKWHLRWDGFTYTNGLCVDLNDKNRVVVVDGMTVLTSTDGGVSWNQKYTDSASAFNLGIKINPSQSFRSTGLEVTTSYWLTWLDSASIFAGFNDLLAMRSTDGGRKWSFDYSGLDSSKINDINMVLKHPSSGVLYAAAGELAGSNGDFTDARVKIVPGRISMSADNGVNWQTMRSFGHAVTSISFDPTSPNRMYATVMDTLGGMGGVYVCQDITPGPLAVWTPVPDKSPGRSEGRAVKITVLSKGELLAVFGPRDTSKTSKPSFQYSNSSGIFYSTDGGSSWTDRSHANMLKATVNVEIDPNDPSDSTWLAFVSTNQTSNPGVYRSTDRGANWTRIYTNAANSATFHPTRPHEMYLSTHRNGLLYVTQTNTPSPKFIQDTAYPFRTPLKVFFNPYNVNEVWVTSHGNGLRVGQTQNVATHNHRTLAAPSKNDALFPNPNDGKFSLSLNIRENGIFRCSLVDVTGETLSEKQVYLEKGMNTLTMSEQLPCGIYLLNLFRGDEIHSFKFVVN